MTAERFDVAIIGGGCAGLSLATRLAEADLSETYIYAQRSEKDACKPSCVFPANNKRQCIYIYR